jgi:hypothetical protein
LPKRFLDEIVAQMPGLRSVVNYFLCLEDTQEKEEYVVKDISIFLKNRELQDIHVIDVRQEAVDSDCLSSMHPVEYDGSVLYKQLQFLIDSLKQARKMLQDYD